MTVIDLFSLKDKVALVTGGGRGLGEVFALALADAGARVVVCSRKLDACQATAESIIAQGGAALALACDVTNPDDVARVVQATIAEYGGVDVLVNNSGATWGAPAEAMPPERFAQVMQVNAQGTFLMSQAVAVQSMIPRGIGGVIVNIASVAGILGGHPEMIQTVGYSASKGAVIAMTRDLATSWAQYGIRVNAIAPGWFPTKMSTALLERYGDAFRAAIPMHRFGTPEDLQGVILFMASPASSYITGQILVVDGGATVW